ncbi:MAG: hypothetical protein ABSA64_00215 [Sedimentisphaerales bacterium]|jgi:hypothetical protein
MVKRYALMESLSANLHDFLKKVSENLPLPDKKFLRDALIGLIRTGELSYSKIHPAVKVDVFRIRKAEIAHWQVDID